MKKLLAAIAALFIFASTPAMAASGCAYPTSHDSFSNRVAGDFLTVALLNTMLCAIEKLEGGPVRPTNGTVIDPAFAFRDDPDSGMYSGGNGILDFSTNSVYRMRIDASGRVLIKTGVATGSVGGDVVLANNTSLRFVRADDSSSASFYIHGSPQDNMEFSVPAGTDEYTFNWAGTNAIKFQRQNNAGGIVFIGEGLTGDHAAPANNNAVLYLKDNGSGLTQLCVRFNTSGTCFATE